MVNKIQVRGIKALTYTTTIARKWRGTDELPRSDKFQGSRQVSLVEISNHVTEEYNST